MRQWVLCPCCYTECAFSRGQMLIYSWPVLPLSEEINRAALPQLSSSSPHLCLSLAVKSSISHWDQCLSFGVSVWFCVSPLGCPVHLPAHQSPYTHLQMKPYISTVPVIRQQSIVICCRPIKAEWTIRVSQLRGDLMRDSSSWQWEIVKRGLTGAECMCLMSGVS